MRPHPNIPSLGSYFPLALVCVALFAFAACARAQTPLVEESESIPAAAVAPEYIDKLPVPWRALATKLRNAGLSGPAVEQLLARLPPSPTQSPMGRKIRELYNKAFYPKARQSQTGPYYKGVVTQANAELCRQYINAHKVAFAAAEEKYGVSPAIGAALLFVETRLGKVLGDIPENAFYTLASMAASDTPESVSAWLPKLSGYEKHMPWLRENLRKRSDWAFNETVALIRHMIKDNIAPERLPGSIYGAVGICQFMPSNISVYGADGDNDGRVDLFTPADAIASLSKYLAKHGWKAGNSGERQHSLLMTYNHSTVYANTILALSKLINNPGLKAEDLTPVPKKRSAKK
ncbi:MAG: lytic murein transglycosylase [Desulfovibrio sp.]|nr:lytic murein transglycosylase [Desulfovibrio sp.]